MGIETEFGIKFVEQKEILLCLVLSEFFIRMRTNVIALNFIRRYHPITVLLIFENVFYLEKNV